MVVRHRPTAVRLSDRYGSAGSRGLACPLRRGPRCLAFARFIERSAK